MLTMDANWYTGRPGNRLNLERGEIAAVHDGGAQLPEQLEKLGVLPDAVARRLVQRDVLHIAPLDALVELCHLSQRQNGVTIGMLWHVVDQVDNAILQTTGIKAVHHVQHQRTRITWHVQSPISL